MTDLRQAAQQALAALENIYLTLPPESVLAKSLNHRITALRNVLEQQSEPVQMPNDMAQQMADARHLERFKPRLKFTRAIEAKLKERNGY